MSRTVNFSDDNYEFSKKDLPICVLRILEQYSDKEHALSLGDICSYVKNIYHFDIQERSVSSAVKGLHQCGYDVENSHDGKIFLKNRVFNGEQITYLARLLSNDKDSDLKNSVFEQILNTFSEEDKFQYQKSFQKASDINKETKKLFGNIAIIDEAIRQKKRLNFYYFDLVLINNELKPRPIKSENRDRVYYLSPYYTFLYNHQYYVLGNLDGDKHNPRFFRIDYMKSLGMISTGYVPKETLPFFDHFDLDKFIRQHRLPYIEDVCKAELVLSTVHDKDLRYIYDDFGDAKDVVKYHLENNQTHIDLTNGIHSIVYFVLSHPRSYKLTQRNSSDPVYKAFKEELDELVLKYYTPAELDQLKDQLNK